MRNLLSSHFFIFHTQNIYSLTSECAYLSSCLSLSQYNPSQTPSNTGEGDCEVLEKGTVKVANLWTLGVYFLWLFISAFCFTTISNNQLQLSIPFSIHSFADSIKFRRSRLKRLGGPSIKYHGKSTNFRCVFCFCYSFLHFGSRQYLIFFAVAICFFQTWIHQAKVISRRRHINEQ